MTYGNNPVENHTVVVPTSRQFSKVFASLVSCKAKRDKLNKNRIEHTLEAWFQYSSSLISPIFVSRMTDSILADAVEEVESDREGTAPAAKILPTQS